MSALKVCPTYLGPVVMGSNVALTLVMVLSRSVSDEDAWIFMSVVAALSLPCFTLMASSARAYYRSISTMDQQLSQFSPALVDSSCCQCGHEDGSLCDRKIILRSSFACCVAQEPISTLHTEFGALRGQILQRVRASGFYGGLHSRSRVLDACVMSSVNPKSVWGFRLEGFLP